MCNISIRKATLDDLSVIQSFNNELFKLEKENYDPTLVVDWPLSKDGENYFKNLITNDYVILALVDDVIVGYLAGTINDKGSYEQIQYGEINNMLVNDKHRGSGIGKKLIDSFKDYCKENGIYNLKVVASSKNSNAINFYKKQGFNDFDITLTMNMREK